MEELRVFVTAVLVEGLGKMLKGIFGDVSLF